MTSTNTSTAGGTRDGAGLDQRGASRNDTAMGAALVSRVLPVKMAVNDPRVQASAALRKRKGRKREGATQQQVTWAHTTSFPSLTLRPLSDTHTHADSLTS